LGDSIAYSRRAGPRCGCPRPGRASQRLAASTRPGRLLSGPVTTCPTGIPIRRSGARHNGRPVTDGSPRWLPPGEQYPLLWADHDSVPITRDDVQIWSFCAPVPPGSAWWRRGTVPGATASWVLVRTWLWS